MNEHSKPKRAFKINGDALSAVELISQQTHRNLTCAIEYLVMQGYKKHEEEAIMLNSLKK